MKIQHRHFILNANFEVTRSRYVTTLRYCCSYDTWTSNLRCDHNSTEQAGLVNDIALGRERFRIYVTRLGWWRSLQSSKPQGGRLSLRIFWMRCKPAVSVCCMVVVAFSTHVRIFREGTTNHSAHALLFVYFVMQRVPVKDLHQLERVPW